MSVAGGKAEVPELNHDFRFWPNSDIRPRSDPYQFQAIYRPIPGHKQLCFL